METLILQIVCYLTPIKLCFSVITDWQFMSQSTRLLVLGVKIRTPSQIIYFKKRHKQVHVGVHMEVNILISSWNTAVLHFPRSSHPGNVLTVCNCATRKTHPARVYSAVLTTFAHYYWDAANTLLIHHILLREANLFDYKVTDWCPRMKWQHVEFTP